VPRGSSAQLKVEDRQKRQRSGKSHVEFALVGAGLDGKIAAHSGSSKASTPVAGPEDAERTGIGGARQLRSAPFAGHCSFMPAQAAERERRAAGGARARSQHITSPVR